ncbi:MAG: hypothetical protein ACK5V3_09560 [Bdellovibrionales bacterium]
MNFVDENQFQFSSTVNPKLNTGVFCQSCYGDTVLDEIQKYEMLLAKAQAVDVFHKKQSKETRLIKRKEKPLSVVDCLDEEEALLKLAFLAAEKGFSQIIDVDLQPRKVTLNKYHSTLWSGTAVPVKK